jgi:TIR domain
MIAISYRREDSTPIAGRLNDRLRAEFGKENVFMDFDSIPYGVDFREHIARTLEKADIVIAVIGPRWLGDRGESTRRIDDATDFVRLEIAGALQRGIPVIPILVDNMPMPREDTLPSDLKLLVFRNAMTLDAGIDFHHHVDRLIAGVRGQLRDIQSSARRSKQKIRDGKSGQSVLDSGHTTTAPGRFKWVGVLNKLISPAPSSQQNQGLDVRPPPEAPVAGPVTAAPNKMSAQEKAAKQKRASRSKKQSIQPESSSKEPPHPATVPGAAPVQEQAIAPPPPAIVATAVTIEKEVIATPPQPIASPPASVQERPKVLASSSVAATSPSVEAKRPQNSLFSGRLLGLVLAIGLVAFVSYFVLFSRSKPSTNVQPAAPAPQSSPLSTPDAAVSPSSVPQPTAQASVAEAPPVVSSASPAADSNDHQTTTGDTMLPAVSVPPPSTAAPAVEPSASNNQKVNSVTSVDDETVRQFVRDYYAALSRHDLDTVVSKFSDAVDYEGQGHHDRKYIRIDIRNYFRRWDKIVFEGGDISVSRNGDGSFVVSFNFPFAVSKGLSPEKRGVSSDVWVLREEPAGNLQIVSQREKVIAGRPKQRKAPR